MTPILPGLLTRFTASDINGLIVPRPHLSIVGTADPHAPIAGVDVIDQSLSRAYAAAGAPDHWRIVRYDVGHHETPAARDEVVAFLQRFL